MKKTIIFLSIFLGSLLAMSLFSIFVYELSTWVYTPAGLAVGLFAFWYTDNFVKPTGGRDARSRQDHEKTGNNTA